ALEDVRHRVDEAAHLARRRQGLGRERGLAAAGDRAAEIGATKPARRSLPWTSLRERCSE
ncbi:hypothetical protein, partial [[Kitasatospora] papulosa]|uniref:hypothetical protein n=1 Tax=[Kitasatospora] papulosa TaxID=1464011 RepID=UPI0036C5B901